MTKTTLSNQKDQDQIPHKCFNRIVCDIIQRLEAWGDEEKVGHHEELHLCFSVEVILSRLSLKNGVQLSSLIAAFGLAHSFSSYKGLFTSIVNTVDRKCGSAGKSSKHSV